MGLTTGVLYVYTVFIHKLKQNSRLTLRILMSYILDVSRSHTTTQHSR